MLLRENRRAGRHPTDQRKGQLGQPRQRELAASASIDRPKVLASQTDAAGGAADQFDDALACQRLQMFLSRIGRLEAQLTGDFSACGRCTGPRDGRLDEFQNLLLAGCKLGRVGRQFWHVNLMVGLVAYPVTVFFNSF